MSSIDPATMAQQLATFDVQSFRQRYTNQASQYQSQLDALGKVESALREFRTAVNDMNNSTSGIIKNSATVSSEGFFTASADSKALTGSYQIFVEQIATAHQVSTGMPANLEPTTEIPLTGTLEFKINGETMTLDLSTLDSDGDGKATMADLTSAINNDSDNPGVNATLVRSGGQTHFMLSSEETGVANKIEVSATGIGQSWFEDAFTNLNQISEAKDAIIWLGAKDSGLKLEGSSNTFSDAIDGLDITVSKAQETGESPLTLSVSGDNDATKEQVTQFVDAYNKLMSTVDEYTKVDTENNTRAVLASDPTLRAIESQVKSVVRGDFGGLRLSQVGIEIDRNGKMKIDSEKFEQAQIDNSAGLEAMFNGDGNLLDSIDTIIEPYLQFSSGLFKSRKDALKQNIDRISDKQVVLDRKYDMAYDRYLKQFTQMNTIMRQMNQTMSMFG
ncbi:MULTISPECIES: flagellar filament capping protein FliD [Vibrio]|uniref:flagellar filament capping protein FliD n=1 Tax=Vibrio TaxID=662 RepID=UPI0020761E76|nr:MULTISPECIES: flagellar filament capping protein FliD [Vibrio]USD31720.1 flagellar filament capping protein FliD [Vibrio sp. SCSIO 43186]USD44766.1 flagellar filament capping protein FliD [Vibrio sp. SCSIO 43145]USD68843.1 flagellar filament capping protein FliD [Vibrio sp. SCSIO 43139]USD96533.1 flagellar hook-associated protein [Vibrio coralliilyticus]